MNQPNPCTGMAQCEFGRALIAQATEGVPSIAEVSQIQAQLAHCLGCSGALSMELRFKVAMAAGCREEAPQSLQLKISESLKRVDLSGIDVTDL